MESFRTQCEANQNLFVLQNVESLPAVFEIDSFQTTTAQQPLCKPKVYRLIHDRLEF